MQGCGSQVFDYCTDVSLDREEGSVVPVWLATETRSTYNLRNTLYSLVQSHVVWRSLEFKSHISFLRSFWCGAGL